MKTFLLALALCLPLSATMVTFDTTAKLNCTAGAVGCGTDTVIIDNVIMHYVGLTAASAEANPGSFIGLGFIAVGCIGGGVACGPTVMPADLSLLIHINQTSPIGVGDLPSGDIDGRIRGTASSASISWDMPANVLIGGFLYGVLNSPLGIVPPSQDNCPSVCPIDPGPIGWNSIQGFVRQPDRPGQTPEPATYSLIGFGLIGLALRKLV